MIFTPDIHNKMNIRYDEWLPGSLGLAGIVTAYWRVIGDGASVPSSAVLPDGHVELVFNLGDPVGLTGPAFDGLQPDRAVVGTLSKALRLDYRGLVNTVGIRFHPARGAGFLGKTATELAERLLPLSQVCPRLDDAFAQLLMDHPSVETDACRDALDRVLLDQLRFALPPDSAVIAAIDRLTSADVMPLVKELADESQISARQLQRRFRTAVGMTPKRFVQSRAICASVATGLDEPAWHLGAPGRGARLRRSGTPGPRVSCLRRGAADPCFYSGLVRSDGDIAPSGPVQGVRSVQDSRLERKL